MSERRPRSDPDGHGAGERRPHPPGWYADPADATRLAYWDGHKWTGQYRPQPTWTDRLPGKVTGVRGARGAIPGHGRRQWIIGAAAVAVIVALAWLALPRRGSDGPKVLTDEAFVTMANEKCTSTINGLRPPLIGDSEKDRPTNVQQADRVDFAADGLEHLARDLDELPVSGADQAYVAGWLDDWRRFAAIGHDVADTLRSPRPNDAFKIGSEGDDFQRRADRFARANGIDKCQFFIVPPSTGRDPFSGG